MKAYIIVVREDGHFEGKEISVRTPDNLEENYYLFTNPYNLKSDILINKNKFKPLYDLEEVGLLLNQEYEK